MAKIVVTEEKTHFTLMFRYNKELVEDVKLIPGRKFDGTSRLWKIPLTGRRALKRLIEKWEGQQIAHEQVPIVEQEASTVYPTCTRSQPWPHQLQALRYIWNKPAALLHLDMGSGKSKIIVDYVINKPDIRRVLIVAPLSVVGVWPQQFALHGGKPVLCAQLDNTAGNVTDKLKHTQLVCAEAARRSMIAVIVVNYEALWREPFAGWALDAKFDLLVLDECQAIKSPGSKVSKFAHRLSKVIPVRFGCSGTPCSHGPMDIYGIYRTLDSTIFGTRYLACLTSYTILGKFQKILGYINQDAMREKIDRIRFRVTPEGYVLPPEVHSDIILTLPDKARVIYKKLEKEFYAGVEDGSVTVANAAVLLTRLQALASGFLPVEDSEGTTTLREMHTEKHDALVGYFDGLEPSEAVVVFCRFRRDLETIHAAAKAAGRTSSELSGSVKTLGEWQSGKTTVLAAQIRASATGVSMVRAHRAVYLTYGFSLADFLQSKARIRRPGQEQDVCYYTHIVVKGTVDQRIRLALEKKEEIIGALMGG